MLNLRLVELAGIAQLARASAFQAEGRGFESRFPLHLLGLGELVICAHVAQWWSTSLVRKRSSVQSRSWALDYCCCGRYYLFILKFIVIQAGGNGLH